jgi:hypothetical protein
VAHLLDPLHHGLHVLELLDQAVDLLNGRAGAGGDAAAARGVQESDVAPLGPGHRADDRGLADDDRVVDRGAGELLGDEQSGQIQEVGFGLYRDLLERAVNALKSGREPDLERPMNQGPEVELGVPALLPADYVPDVHTRLTLYKRIASAGNEAALRELQVELIDRFGLLPDYAKNLFRGAELRLQGGAVGQGGGQPRASGITPHNL